MCHGPVCWVWLDPLGEVQKEATIRPIFSPFALNYSCWERTPETIAMLKGNGTLSLFMRSLLRTKGAFAWTMFGFLRNHVWKRDVWFNVMRNPSRCQRFFQEVFQFVPNHLLKVLQTSNSKLLTSVERLFRKPKWFFGGQSIHGDTGVGEPLKD